MSAVVALEAESQVFTLTGLTSGKTYTVQASFDNTFTDADAVKSATFDTLPPRAESIAVSDEGQQTATVTVTVSAPNGSDLHLRYRTGTETWAPAQKPAVAGASSVEFALSGLTSDRTYEVEASFDSSFATDATATGTIDTLPPTVESVVVRDPTKTTATAYITIAAPNGDMKTARIRYQLSANQTDDWSDVLTVDSDTDSATKGLEDLAADTQYELEATLAGDFTSGAQATTIFSTLGVGAGVKSVTFADADIAQTSGIATVTVANAGGVAKTVHLRYRTAGDTPGSWSTPALQEDSDPNNSDTARITISGLSAGTKYDVQASLDSTFATGTQSADFKTKPPDPVITGVTHKDVGERGATITVTVDHHNGSSVYVKYRTAEVPPDVQAGAWVSAADFAASTRAHLLTLSSLNHSTKYDVGASFSNASPFTPVETTTFTTLTPDPRLALVEVSNIVQSGPAGAVTGTVTVTVANAGNQTRTIYLRYREVDTATWSSSILISGIETATTDITTLMVSTHYELQASFDQNFTNPANAKFHTPILERVSVTVDGQDAEVTGMIEHPGQGEKSVHFKYGPVEETSGQKSNNEQSNVDGTKSFTETFNETETTEGNSVTLLLSDLVPNQEYTVKASLDDSFGRGVQEESFFTTGGTTGGGNGGSKPPVIIGGGDGGGGGGFGGPPPKPVPSDEDFRWNVNRDINSLYSGDDQGTGIWSDHEHLWVLQNSSSGPDEVYVYNLETGERVEDLEFELDRQNRFSHGIWSDGETIWVSDSQRDKLFAYELETGERLPDLDIELHEDNRDPRDIWSDGEVVYVIDNRRDSLFVYNLETGEFIAEYELDKLNRDPKGIWSDGVSIWISDDGANRIFAYRLGEDGLERIESEEFGYHQLLRATNSDPRGIWSDGGVMFVLDHRDDRVYSYNMPDAIDARLSSLSLTDITIDQFAPWQTLYRPAVLGGIFETTLEATPMQEEATVVPVPVDIDSDPENGHQAEVNDKQEITVEVTSPDGTRTRTYRVEIQHCLSGLTNARLSDVSYTGGTLSELEVCARSFSVDWLYHHTEAGWTGYFFDAPTFLSQPFFDRFTEEIPTEQPLIAKREPGAGVPCITGLRSTSLSPVRFVGGSLAELEACARKHSLEAFYHHSGRGWTGLFIDAPAFLSQPFKHRFAGGLTPGELLIAKRTPASDPKPVVVTPEPQVETPTTHPAEEPEPQVSTNPNSEPTADAEPSPEAVESPVSVATEPSTPEEPCLTGLTDQLLSNVRFVGGSLDELRACARSLSIDTIFHRSDGDWAAFFPNATRPELYQAFADRFPTGLPAGIELVAKREPVSVSSAPTGSGS